MTVNNAELRTRQTIWKASLVVDSIIEMGISSKSVTKTVIQKRATTRNLCSSKMKIREFEEAFEFRDCTNGSGIFRNPNGDRTYSSVQFRNWNENLLNDRFHPGNTLALIGSTNCTKVCLVQKRCLLAGYISGPIDPVLETYDAPLRRSWQPQYFDAPLQHSICTDVSNNLCCSSDSAVCGGTKQTL